MTASRSPDPRHNDAPPGDTPPDDALQWLIALSEAPDDDALRARLEAWRAADPGHEAAWREACAVDALIGETALADRTSPVASTAPPPRRPARRWRRLAPPIAAAALAACLVLALLPGLTLRWQADHLTGTGETKDIPLADGSIIHLAAGSAVTVRYDDTARRITLLEGEAYFEVAPAPERPFTVAAGRVSATALGTAFNVLRSSENAEVAVRKGTVRVVADQTTRTLTAGDWLRLDKTLGQSAHGHGPPDMVAAWRQGRLATKNERLSDAVDRLRRQYRGAILLTDDALADRRITGYYDLSRPDQALAAMVAPGGGTVRRITPWLLVVSD